MKTVLRWLLVFSAVATSPESFAQSHLWLFLKTESRALPSPDDLGISDRSLQRRKKVLPIDQLIDGLDVPPPSTFLKELTSAGFRIRTVSRWLNAVSVEAGEEPQLRTLLAHPLIERVEPVRSFIRQRPDIATPPPRAPKTSTAATLDYGTSLTQLNNINVVDLHNLGIDGTGVVVGMIDDGFNNHRTHEALRGIRVLAEYDFINRDSNTSFQPGETDGGGGHGQATLSALAGYSPGNLIGPAFGASFLLGKTEVGAFEQPIEEDYYVEALEWMEREGADIVSTSLGYCDWYDYAQMDGNTAVTSIAARVAARKGVLLVTAMGNTPTACYNNLNGEPALIAPADADSIIAVGATYSDMQFAEFSLRGPTADGRTKPEVVAQGVSVKGALLTGYGFFSGTSMSTPLVAGAAALILSAQRDLTPMQVREALIATAQQIADQDDPSRSAVYPNNYYGHGMIDTRAALTYHGVALGLKPGILRNDSTITVSIFIVSDIPLVADSLAVVYQKDPTAPFQRQVLSPTATPDLYTATLPVSSSSGAPRGYFTARDQSGRSRTSPYNAPADLHTFAEPRPFALHQNYPNPFNAATTILFDAPGTAEVELTVYDLLGRKVRTIYRGLSWAGANIHTWRGDDDAGRAVSSGLYIVRIHSSDFVQSRKVLLIR